MANFWPQYSPHKKRVNRNKIDLTVKQCKPQTTDFQTKQGKFQFFTSVKGICHTQHECQWAGGVWMNTICMVSEAAKTLRIWLQIVDFQPKIFKNHCVLPPIDPLLRQRRCKELNHLLSPGGSIQRLLFYISSLFALLSFTAGSLLSEPLKLPIIK